MQNKIDAVLNNAGIDDHQTVVKIHYALDVIRNEVIKLVIIGIVFSLYGNLMEYIYSLAILLPLRTFSGGMHMKTNIGCFMFSLIFLMLPIKVLPRISLNIVEYFSLLIISITTISILSPIASYKRPIKTAARKDLLKKRALFCIAIESIILFTLWLLAIQDYFIIGAWIVTIHAIQLFATWAYRKMRGGIKNVGETQEMEAITHRSPRG